MGNAASDFISGIDNAQSHLNSFNSTIFASSEEQQELRQNMDEIQQGITDICKRASDERRGYTQEEITQLDEYFTKLRDLKNREIEIQSQIATAITQQATTNAQSFQGSLDEYKVQSQEWIKTATEQKNATVALIEQGTIEEVALLNQRYSTEEERQSEAYQKEYNAIMEQKQTKIDMANDEVAKVSEVYANGYLERSKQNDGFYAILQEYNKKVEEEKNRHNSTIESIENNGMLNQYNKNSSKEQEDYRHNNELKKIWQKMYKNMSDSQAEQLGVWLAQVSQTELYGGKIEDETKQMVDAIMDSYDSMPDKTRKSMKDAMSPMLDEMKKSEPSLFAKARSIADGIVERLRKAFDEHSPSKKTRQIMKFAMQPMEEELEKGNKKLTEEASKLAENVNDELRNIDGNVEMQQTYRSGQRTDRKQETIIDYEKLYLTFLRALNSCKMKVDKDGFIHLIDDRLMEVM